MTQQKKKRRDFSNFQAKFYIFTSKSQKKAPCKAINKTILNRAQTYFYFKKLSETFLNQRFMSLKMSKFENCCCNMDNDVIWS